MDPISVITSVLSVIEITHTVTTRCMQYIKSARNVNEEVLMLVREIGGLKIVLDTIEQILNRGKQSQEARDRDSSTFKEGGTDDTTSLSQPTPRTCTLEDEHEDPYLLSTLQKICALKPLFDECKSKLEKLGNEIESLEPDEEYTKKEALKRALGWPLKESSFQSTVNNISHYIRTFSVALSLEEMNVVLDVHKLTKNTYHTVLNIRSTQEEENNRRLSEDIIRWLAAPEPSPDYNHALLQRSEHTGLWLLQHKQYKTWKSSPRSLLWLYGTAGCGKTVLSSRALEDLSSVSESESTTPVIYFYFKADDVSKCDSTKMLRGLIKQLFRLTNWKSDPLRLLYERQNPQNPLTRYQLLTTLCEMASELDDVYIVLDALDECKDPSHLYGILEEIGQWQKVNCHLLVTSREEQDIREALESMNLEKIFIKLTAELLKDDIYIYVSSRLGSDTGFKRWKKHPDVRKEIEYSLTENAGGMFQWIVCQMEELQKCHNPPQLRKTLQSLPKTLYDTYAIMLSRIPDEHYEVALRMIYSVLFSERPLSIEELAELAALNINEDTPVVDSFWDSTDCLRICPGFLTTIEGGGDDEGRKKPKILVRVAHISIREYLLSHHIGQSNVSRYKISRDNANSTLAKCCLLYILLLDKPFSTAAQRFPLADYALKYWLVHYENVSDPDDPLHKLVLNFLISHNDIYKDWAESFFKGYDGLGVKQRNKAYLLRSPLNFAVAYSLFPLIKLMFTSKDIDTESSIILRDALRSFDLDTFFPRPQHPNVAVVKFLIENGGDLAKDEEFQSTLHGACYYGIQDIVKEELESGVDVNVPGGRYESALAAAIWGRRWPGELRSSNVEFLKVIRLLLDHGANVNSRGQMVRSPLWLSCVYGDTDVVETMLTHGANPNGTGEEETPVQVACFTGNKILLEMLLKYGANPNLAAGNARGYWFSICAEIKDIYAMRLMLIHGWSLCNIEDEDKDFFSVKRQDRLDGSLHEKADVIKAYLRGFSGRMGFDASDCGWPLQIAIKFGKNHIVDVLLRHDVDIHKGGGKAGSPLNEAILAGNPSVVEQLIKKSVNVNLLGGDYGSPLQCASLKGYWPFVDSLLENGADPNIRGGKYHTTLQAAFQQPDSESFNLLLDKGADIAVESRYGTTLGEALHHALQDLSEVYIEQTWMKDSKLLWRVVKKSVDESFTLSNYELCRVESSKGRDDPAFLCSLEPVDGEFEG